VSTTCPLPIVYFMFSLLVLWTRPGPRPSRVGEGPGLRFQKFAQEPEKVFPREVVKGPEKCFPCDVFCVLSDVSSDNVFFGVCFGQCLRAFLSRAALPYTQGVAGSSPAPPTILLLLEILYPQDLGGVRVHHNGSHTVLHLRASYDVPSLTPCLFQRASDHTFFPF